MDDLRSSLAMRPRLAPPIAPVLAWLGRGRPDFLGRLALALGGALLGCLGFTAYESLALGLTPFRYEPALFGPYHLARSGFALVSSGLIVWTIAGGWLRGREARRDGLRRFERAAAFAVMAGALACAGVFVADSAAFNALAVEDGPVEWTSALLLAAASALMAGDARGRWQRRGQGARSGALGIAVSIAFALLFFAMAMEEVSWMQRLLGFGTPAELAQLNWQHEFNLHNTHTFLFDCVFYCAAGGFLLLAPLLAEAAPRWAPLRIFADHIPGRAVAAVSAPVSMFNYGHWNVLPIQLSMMVTVWVLLAYATLASRHRRRAEARLFLLLGAGVVTGQAALLLLGGSAAQIPDSTEYQELFIALGFAAFALGVRARHSSES